MEKAFVMIDAGFLSKVSYELGDGHYFNYDLIKFSKMICGSQEFIFKKLFFYNAPPYQSNNPSENERKRKEDYDSFVSRLDFSGDVIIREGRCQRLRQDGRFIYKQKGVDTLLTMGLMDVPIKYPEIKRIILIASDSDFVPIIERLRELGIDIILYTYFNRSRNSNFSRSNELIKSVTRYVKLRKEDFDDCRLG